MSESFKNKIYDQYVSTHNRNLYGENSLKKIEKHFPSWAYYFKKILPRNKDSAILDVGCGDGNFVYWLSSLGFRNVTGVDVSNEQIESGLGMGITGLCVGDSRDYLQQRKACFDFIILRDVLEHFTREEVFEIVRLIQAALRPGGAVMLQVPNGQGIFYTSIFYGDITHEWAYTQSALSQVFLNCGFENVQCFEMGPAPVNISGFIRFLFWRYKVLMTRFWKFVESGNYNGIFTSNIIAVAKK